MRAFVILCLVAAACANQLGYNYQPVGHSSNSVPSFAGLQGGAEVSIGSSGSSSYAGSGGVSNFAARSNAAPSFVGSQGVSNYAAGSNVAPSFVGSQGVSDYATGLNAGPSFAGSQGTSDYAAGSSAAPSFAGSQGDLGQASHDNAAFAPQAELEKEFFTYTANDEDFNDPAASNQLSNSVKQGLRVIFIKGPENSGLENAALTLAKQGSEQKTDIYVLQKQADLSTLANKLSTDNKNNNNKPEVHFVKYRTQEDAINAQKAIQGQYDSLGGTSQSHDGGVAPVLNFASKAPVATHGSAGSPGVGSHGAGSLGAGSLGASSLGGSSFGTGSIGTGSLGGVSNVGASYIPPSSSAGVSAPGPSYLPASIFRRL
ncbi:haze protective factor 1-like [Lucilia sericata]|uniref:haze protective factor 1-like n=1 Tax=Lucilia sericata TaxID=13632 RepID=UPI0018A80A0E|nr:haze protective factor 1-like [Lucilia sericata]